MNASYDIDHLHKVIASLGAVWKIGFPADNDEFIALSPGGPYHSVDDFTSAELEIGYKIPLEYKYFLTHYGSPYFMGSKLMTIYPPGDHATDDLPASDDLVAHYYLNIKHGLLQPGELAILETEENGFFFYKCEPISHNGDSPSIIYRVFGNDDERKAFSPSLLSLLSRWVVESE